MNKNIIPGSIELNEIFSDALKSAIKISESLWLNPMRIATEACNKIQEEIKPDCCIILQLLPTKEDNNFIGKVFSGNQELYNDVIGHVQDRFIESIKDYTKEDIVPKHGVNELVLPLFDWVTHLDNENQYTVQPIHGQIWIKKDEGISIPEQYWIDCFSRSLVPALSIRQTFKTVAELTALQIHEQLKYRKDPTDPTSVRIKLYILEIGSDLWIWDVFAHAVDSSISVIKGLNSKIDETNHQTRKASITLRKNDFSNRVDSIFTELHHKFVKTDQFINCISTQLKNSPNDVYNSLYKLIDECCKKIYDSDKAKNFKKSLENITPRQLGTFTPYHLEIKYPKENDDKLSIKIHDIIDKIKDLDNKLFGEEMGIICDKTLLAHIIGKAWNSNRPIPIYPPSKEELILKKFKDNFDDLKSHQDIFKYLVYKIGELYGLDHNYLILESLEQLDKSEPMMYWGIKRYRDHLLHSCRIVLLGLWLLDQEFYFRPSFAIHQWNLFKNAINKIDPKITNWLSEIDLSDTEYERFLLHGSLWAAVDVFLEQWLFPSITDDEKVRQNEVYCMYKKSMNIHYDKAFTYSVERLWDHWCPRFGPRFEEIKSDHSGCKDLVFKCLILAAAKHDVGYCFTYLKGLIETSDFLKKDNAHTIKKINSKFDETFNTLFQMVRTHATSIDSALYDTSSATIPHGVIGAFHVKNLTQDEYVLECTAQAIAKHDDSTRRIYFEEEPLSWILILLDELQEWGRPLYTTHEKNFEDSTVYAQKLLAECDLRYLLWYKEDGEILIPSAKKKAIRECQIYSECKIIPECKFLKQLVENHDSVKYVCIFSHLENDDEKLEYKRISEPKYPFLIFEYDYNPSEETLKKKEVAFSFPHFFYFKQVNLSQLRGGPLIKLRVKRTDWALKQFKTVIDESNENKDYLVREWSKEIHDTLVDKGYYEFELGIGTISRPPNILQNLKKYIQTFWDNIIPK